MWAQQLTVRRNARPLRTTCSSTSILPCFARVTSTPLRRAARVPPPHLQLPRPRLWCCSASSQGEWSVEQSFTEGGANPGMLRMVLVTPQIPGNTGTIARTCAATGVPLHLVAPLGFEIDDKAVKRAGLDYWDSVFCKCHDSWDEFYEYFKLQAGPKRLVGFTKFGADIHTEEGAYQPGDWLLFGSEISGLPEGAWEACRDATNGGGLRRIPINETHVRSLNLAVSAGVGLYEAQRQTDLALGIAQWRSDQERSY